MSVCGTDPINICLEDFLESLLFLIYPGEPEHFQDAWTCAARIYLRHILTYQTQIQLCARNTKLCPSIAIYRSHGILTVCPSRSAFAIRLGPTNPSLIVIAKETLIFRRAGFSPALWLLVPTFLLRSAPRWVTPFASARLRILSYRLHLPKQMQTLNFGTRLSPEIGRAHV